MINEQNYCPICLSKLSNRNFVASSETYRDSIYIQLGVNICDSCDSFYLKEFVEEKSIGMYYPKSYYTKDNKIDDSSFNFKVRELAYSIFKGYPIKQKVTFKLLLFSILYGIFFWHRFKRFPRYLENISKPSTFRHADYGKFGNLPNPSGGMAKIGNFRKQEK